jgi:hypothetical protein
MTTSTRIYIYIYQPCILYALQVPIRVVIREGYALEVQMLLHFT